MPQMAATVVGPIDGSRGHAATLSDGSDGFSPASHVVRASLVHLGRSILSGLVAKEVTMFVVTVPDQFARHLVTKVMDDWHQAVRWARQHSADGCALIRDQQVN